MTTLQNLIDACEADLADSGNATWSAADITQWCRDAIADYSLHFPLTEGPATSTPGDGVHTVDLPKRFVEIISVEFPGDEDPPQFLERRPHTHPDFWREDGYFDILRFDDASDPDQIVFSNGGDGSSKLYYYYQAPHDESISAGSTLTVPPSHEHILRAFVRWQATAQLKAIEEASPTSNSSLIMSQLAINVDRARRAYVDALAKAVFAASKSAVVSWAGQDESADRIY